MASAIISAVTVQRPTDLTRRQLLAGAGAGAAACCSIRTALRAQPRHERAIVFTHTTVVNPDTVQNDVALAVAGDRIAAIGSERPDPQDLPERRRLRRTRQGALPGSDQLSRAHEGGARSVASTKTSDSPTRRSLAVQPGSLLQGEEATLMVDRRRARSDSHRHDDVCRECRRHRPIRRGVGASGIAVGLRRIDPRQRERARSAVARGPREERDAALLAEAARRGHAAHQRSVHRLARQEQRTHQRVPRGGADRDVLARTAAGACARSRTNTTSATPFT